MLNSVDLVPHRGSRVMVNGHGLVSWCLRRSKVFSRVYFVGPKFFLVGVSWVRIFLSRVFGRSKFFFVGILWVQKWAFRGFKIFFLVGVSWIQNFFSWVCCRSKIFSHAYFVGPKILFVGISWVQHLCLWIFPW